MKTNTEDILFSIVIATYNRAQFIERAIDSVFEQTYANWELIVIDDGSQDNTKVKVLSYQDNRIKYQYQDNKGRSEARNLGIELSTGQYISFLDDDDYLLSEYLQEFYTEISNRNFTVAAFMCDQREINKQGKTLEAQKKDFNENNSAKFILKYANNIQPLCISKEILNEEKFDSKYEIGEDFHLLYRIALKYAIYYFPKTLCVYVNHDSMTMERELKDSLYMTNPYNRLDVINYFFEKHKDLLDKNNVTTLLSNKYNKIAYFYASQAIKTKHISYGLKIIDSIKWGGNKTLLIYYKFSIYVRALIYGSISFFRIAG